MGGCCEESFIDAMRFLDKQKGNIKLAEKFPAHSMLMILMLMISIQVI